MKRNKVFDVLRWVSLPVAIILAYLIGYIITMLIGKWSWGQWLDGDTPIYLIRTIAAIIAPIAAYQAARVVAPKYNPKIGIVVCVYIIAFIVIAAVYNFKFSDNNNSIIRRVNNIVIIIESVASTIVSIGIIADNIKKLISNNK